MWLSSRCDRGIAPRVALCRQDRGAVRLHLPDYSGDVARQQHHGQNSSGSGSPAFSADFAETIIFSCQTIRLRNKLTRASNTRKKFPDCEIRLFLNSNDKDTRFEVKPPRKFAKCSRADDTRERNRDNRSRTSSRTPHGSRNHIIPAYRI